MDRIRIVEHTTHPAPVVATTRELRPDYGSDELMLGALQKLVAEQGLRIFGAHLGDEPVAAAVLTARVLENLVSGRFLYIDDLGTSAAFRGRGLAGALFDHAEELAAELGCVGGIQLNSGLGENRADAHGFYFGRGLRIASFTFRRR